MVNVGTGNLVLQDDDMSVPHKGIALAFRRTYNSQSPTTVTGDLQTWEVVVLRIVGRRSFEQMTPFEMILVFLLAAWVFRRL